MRLRKHRLFLVATLNFMAWSFGLGRVEAGMPGGQVAGGTSGERKIAISSRWTLQISVHPDKALVRAARDLQSYLAERHGIQLRIEEGGQGRKQEIDLAVNDRLKDDGFSIRMMSSRKRLYIEGPSSRAVYQGVLQLEEDLQDRPELPATFRKSVVFPFRDRYLIWDALLTGQNKGAVGFNLEQYVREALRLGYTGMQCNRFVRANPISGGSARDPYPWFTYWGASMDQFLASPLFEGVYPKEYLNQNLEDLKHVTETIESFGMKPIFLGYEPRFVPEQFLERHPELRGARVDHPSRGSVKRYALCVDQGEVLAHYRFLAKQLAEEVLGIKEMYVIFHDSGAGLCWADELYSGRNGPEHCRNIPMGERMRNFFMAIKQGLEQSGHSVALTVQPHGITRREIDAFFQSVPKDVAMTAGNWPSWDLLGHDPLESDRYVLKRSRESGRRSVYYQQHFFGFDNAPTSEFPTPYFLAERLKRARELGPDVLNTLGGIVSPPIKKRSVMQEVYRLFLLEPDLSTEALVRRAGHDLGGREGGELLVSLWKDIHAALLGNSREIGFGKGTEYAARRTLVRPLVPDAAALPQEEREWWLNYTFGGDLRFGHAHLFRSEGGLPSPEWYAKNYGLAVRSRDAFQGASRHLMAFLRDHPADGLAYPYLAEHERQLRFLGFVYATGANLLEGQRILDKYSRKNIDDTLRKDVAADLAKFQAVVHAEIENTGQFLEFLEEGGDIGMVVLPQESPWGYGPNLAALLRKKMETMQRHLPEAQEVLHRWFLSE